MRQTAQKLIPPDIQELIARYKNIRVPTLIIWGEEDKVVPLEGGRNFKRDIPAAELVILPKCGHIPQEEQPQETQGLVTKFLKNL